MSTADVSRSAPQAFSVRRVLLTLMPIVALLGGYVAYQRHAYQAEAQQEGERLLLGTLGLAKPTKNKLDARFVDADGDLVADAPQDTTKWIDPDVLHFSYIAGEDARRQQDVWQQFCEALATATGKKVEYLLLDSPEDQLRALLDGRLEIAGVNTGNVPTAVNACGFVPVSTLGAGEGSFGYAVNFLVPAGSSLQSIQDVRGKTIALTEKGSNSGYKAPLVLLMSDFNIFPQRDFDWVYTFGHEASIKGIAAGKYQVAPVASDMLARAIARGGITPEQYRVIYVSERFPPAALGYVYNLKPELAAKIAEVLKTFPWQGTALEQEFAPAGDTEFVPVNYKNDWALIRRIDDAMGTTHVVK